MSGIERIEDTFSRTKREGRAALMPYFTLGYPNMETSLAIIHEIAKAGADLIELGVPFSDPLADGPTIQESTQVALENGIDVRGCLHSVRALRARGVDQPCLFMGYINPILAYGLQDFVADAAQAGVDGLIVPDLPLEEAAELEAACAARGLALVYLVAPTSTPERVAQIVERATGFVYLVSVTGVTGARQKLPADLEAFVGRVRAATDKPLAVGFGISGQDQARLVGELADGVIVGSALINAARTADDPAFAAGRFVGELRQVISAKITNS